MRPRLNCGHPKPNQASCYRCSRCGLVLVAASGIRNGLGELGTVVSDRVMCANGLQVVLLYAGPRHAGGTSICRWWRVQDAGRGGHHGRLCGGRHADILIGYDDKHSWVAKFPRADVNPQSSYPWGFPSFLGKDDHRLLNIAVRWARERGSFVRASRRSEGARIVRRNAHFF
jgi:hypothetical protein